MPTSNICVVLSLERKIQNDTKAPGLVTPTFFLWEIIQKFFFLSWGFHILATQKSNFYDPEGSQWVPEGLLAPFRTKMSYF